MKLKKIVLNNIRSYENQEIKFSNGSTLLSGDIGSGKTSILLGIEFALFGLQPGFRGSSLLRSGKNSGSATIEFEVNGKEIAIERNLKKGKTVSQDNCYLTIDGSKTQLSVMELKSFILELLNYPKEFSKKQNLLYKFTVYTPQEEMKQIILQDSETRTNTLRYVFGVEKYKQIIENTSIIASKIREEKRILLGMISNLDVDKESLIAKEYEFEEKNQNLTSIEKEFFLIVEERKKVHEEKEKISEKIEERIKVQQEIEKVRIMVSNKEETISNSLKNLENLNIQIKELEGMGFDESEILRIEKEISYRKKEKENLNNNLLEVSSQMNSLRTKNEDNKVVKERINHIETCPTCLQKVDSDYKKNILEKAELEISENSEKILSLNYKKENILEKYRKFDSEILSYEKRISDLNLLKIRLQNVNEKKLQITEIEKINQNLKDEINDLNLRIRELETLIFDLKKFDGVFEEKKQVLEEALKRERIIEIKVAELKREIQVFSRQIDEFRERIKSLEETRKRMNYLMEVENWLSTDFVNLISTIERNVMIKLKSQFSRIFSEWFSMLVSESFNVYITDDFSPVIELHDYELDYSYLSGGERTAVALAYRLALNQLINSILSNIETKGIVILDEPTDGFSDQQLDKMRDVLEQLNIKQLIIVSHEQKIEGFVENVIKFTKENGVSVVE